MSRHHKKGPPTLTARERQVVMLAAQGASDKRIGTELHISQHTVGSHLKNIFAKLEIHDRKSLTMYALHRGLVSIQCEPKLALYLADMAGSCFERERTLCNGAPVALPGNDKARMRVSPWSGPLNTT